MPQVIPKARSLFDPRVERFLIADEGEVIVDEVAKHWAAIVKPVMLLVAAVPLLIIAFWVPPQVWWLPALAALALAGWGLWRILQAQMDRFVITNMRVFRVHGILTQNIATMPLARILDISVRRPVVGRIFGFGHFVFESAAQTQGLKEIRYVGAPNERDLTIQRVIARAGLRGPVRTSRRTLPTPPEGVFHQPSTSRSDGPDEYRDGRRDELGPNDTMPIHL
jgi:membrane protein YdbS with pleckstrin-like domain